MKILLAIDDSKYSEAAIKAVIAQGKPEGTEVRVLHIVEPPSLLVTREMGGYDSSVELAWKAQRKRGQELVAKSAEAIRSHGVKCTAELQEGDAKSKILEEADKWGAELIVLGSHGRKGLERFLLGSVSDAVAHHARCSVEVVRLPST
ncbi:MAG TPA: universal stress protein [Candidatus Polarisedimenticolia bacterium]|nr:universal stress protein [Candidatus Polarisedimenticolia bacterium]